MGDRLALVTGGHRRLGATISAALASAGYRLALHGSHDCALEPDLRAALESAGVEWRGFIADFTDPASAATLMADVVAGFGRAPDLLVNNAAIFGQDDLTGMTAETLMRHFAVNSAAPALLIQAFAAAAGGEEGRSVVNILDQRILHPHGDQASYTLSKLALEGLTRLAARDLAPAIRVNAVAPGLTLATDDYSDEQVERLAAAMPLARLSGADDIAAAVLYLAGARAVTGQTLFVDAGAHMVSFDRDFMHLSRD